MMPSSPESRRRIVRILLVAAAYAAAARLSLYLELEKSSATPVWPPSGIAFAALQILGWRTWPGIYLGALLANVATSLSHGAALPLAFCLSAVIAAGNTLEALAGIWLLRAFIGRRDPLGRSRDVFVLAGVAAAMCLVSAAIGPLAISSFGQSPWSLYPRAAFTWWCGDLTGVLIAAPLILAWRPPLSFSWNPRRAAEGVFVFSWLAFASHLEFGGWPLDPSARYPLTFFILPFLVWVALRFGTRESALAIFLVATLAVWRTFRGLGPFARFSLNESLLLLQAFVSTTAITVLAMAAVSKERREAEAALERSNDDLERRVKERTSELARSNADLEQFAYTASHDLQEPLRKILSFGEILERQLTGKLDPQAKESLDRMNGASRRMQSLIQGLLAYSRVTVRRQDLQVVDLGDVVREVLADLESLLKQSEGRVEVDPLPKVRADPTMMRQLMQNLLSNALKFRRPGVPARVAVRNRDTGGGFEEIWIEDNGAGFDDPQQDRLFKLFQRFHGRGEYEGSGIGLAICKKIVERHRGTLSARSEPGRGSTFVLRLPRLMED